MRLVERDLERERLSAAVTAARDGQGSVTVLVGDAGTGKSALLAALLGDVDGVRVLRGGCDPLRTPRPLGPLRDVAGAAVTAVLTGDDMPLPQVCEDLYAWLGSEPTAVAIEDLHWVDDATVDVLRFLVRRSDAIPVALLLTYRDDEIGPSHPVRPLLGDLARSGSAGTLRLGPLSLPGVARLVDGTGLDPAGVHRVTGGNPFFVTEIAKDPDRPLPSSVRDAVLARTAELGPDDVEVLQLVAAAPDRLDDRALPVLGVDLPTLRRLDRTGLLTRARGGLAFRHELARQAVESTVPPGGGPRLHRRLLEALERLDLPDPAVLTHHAVAARDARRAVEHARRAAVEATRAGSHREAAAFYETALEHLGDDIDDTDDTVRAERAELLQRLSFEQYMTSRLGRAIHTVEATFPLWRRAGDAAGLAAAHETCAIYEYYHSHRREAVAHVQKAVDIAVSATTDDGTPARVEVALGAARATLAYLAHMQGDVELATAAAQDATRLADRHGADVRGAGPLALRGRLIAASARLGRGDPDARTELVDLVETARGRAWDELASTGYSQLISLDIEQRRLRAAENLLEVSLPFLQERDIPICQHWQTAMRSRLRLTEGCWHAAVEDASWVLDEVGMPMARLWPHLVTALVELRTGDDGDGGRQRADHHLEEAWALARRLDEPLRTLHVLAALAERRWLTGIADPRVEDDAVRVLHRFEGAPGTAWAVGDLASWLRRLDPQTPPPSPSAVAEPHALLLAGRYAEAAAAWQRIGDPFAAAMARADAPEASDRLRAVALLDAAGAPAVADRVRDQLRRDGVTSVPARSRAPIGANPSGLTNRQLDVARLVARGFTNAEIAGRLYISPKTTDHHVSAVLAKLGLPSRRAVVVQALELGLT